MPTNLTDRLGELVERLFKHIEHGDEAHRAWLKEELEKFFAKDEILSALRKAELLRDYQLFAGETAGKCLALAMSTDHPSPDEVLMGIFEASQELAEKARARLSLGDEK